MHLTCVCQCFSWQMLMVQWVCCSQSCAMPPAALPHHSNARSHAALTLLAPPCPTAFPAASSSGGAFSVGAAPAASSAASIFRFSTAAAPACRFGGASRAAAGGDAAGAAAAPAAGGTSLFGATPASGTPLFGAAQAAPPKVELPGEQAVQTGEEDERTVFSGGWLLRWLCEWLGLEQWHACVWAG